MSQSHTIEHASAVCISSQLLFSPILHFSHQNIITSQSAARLWEGQRKGPINVTKGRYVETLCILAHSPLLYGHECLSSVGWWHWTYLTDFMQRCFDKIPSTEYFTNTRTPCLTVLMVENAIINSVACHEEFIGGTFSHCALTVQKAWKLPKPLL